MHMNSSEIDKYLNLLYRCEGEYPITEESKHMVNKLFEVIRVLEPYRVLKDYREECFLWVRSSDGIWYGLKFSRVFRGEDKGVALFLSVNRGLIVRLLPEGVKSDAPFWIPQDPTDICPLLEWMLEKSESAINLLREGTYMDYVRDSITPECREGRIDCKTYWSFVPEAKARQFGPIDPDIEREFITWVDEHSDDEFGVDKFTSGDYFRACREYYEVTGNLKESDEGKTPKELYKRYSDGRYDRLCELDEDSPEEFDRWLTEGHYEHHTWELDYAHIWLAVEKENGNYYLSLSYYGDYDVHTQIEVIMKLVNRGLPIPARIYKDLVRKLKGDGLIKIVSRLADYEKWLPVDEWRRKREDEYSQLIDTVLLPQPTPDGLVKAITWSDIPAVRLL